jgi:hypothetical protein
VGEKIATSWEFVAAVRENSIAIDNGLEAHAGMTIASVRSGRPGHAIALATYVAL